MTDTFDAAQRDIYSELEVSYRPILDQFGCDYLYVKREKFHGLEIRLGVKWGGGGIKWELQINS